MEMRMTFKVKFKVIQGQTLLFQPKCPGMQGVSVWSWHMTFVVHGSRNIIQNTDSEHRRVTVIGLNVIDPCLLCATEKPIINYFLAAFVGHVGPSFTKPLLKVFKDI
jgi:hypothetical protein